MTITTLEQYRELAKRTLITDQEPYNRMIHMDAGIKGELGELIDQFKKHVIYKKPLDVTNVIEEWGDTMWYVAGKFTFLNEEMSELIQGELKQYTIIYSNKFTSFEDEDLAISILKYLVYVQPKQLSEPNNILAYMFVLADLLSDYCVGNAFDFWGALKYNIEKLQARYPEKYTDQDAIERKDKDKLV